MDLRVVNLPVDLEWTTKVAVEGRLDSITSAQFEKMMEPIVSQPMDFLIMDLSKVPSSAAREFAH